MGNLQIVESIYAAMAAKDPAGVLAHLSDQVTMYQDPRLPWGGDFAGHEGFGQFAVALVGTITSSVRTDDIYESDDRHVVQFGHTIGTVNGDRRAVRRRRDAPVDPRGRPGRRDPLRDRLRRHAGRARRVSVNPCGASRGHRCRGRRR